MKKFLSSLLLALTVLITAAPARAGECNLLKGLMYTGGLSGGRPYIITLTPTTPPTSPYVASSYSGPAGIVDVVAGQTYTASWNATGFVYGRIAFYKNRDEVTQNEKVISYASLPSNETRYTFTVPDEATVAILLFAADGKGSAGISWNNVQIERGSTATTYQPYNPLCATCQGIVKNYESAVGTVAQNGTPTPTNPVEPTFYQQGDMVLRKINDTYYDSYDATTGKITRRVGVKVLDGTEDWQVAANVYIKSDATAAFIPIVGMIQTITADFLCTQLKPDLHEIWQQVGYPNTAQIRTNVNGAQFMVNFGNDIIGITDYTQETTSSAATKIKNYIAQQYAAGTPVTVWYPLATPVEETPASTTYCADAIKIATTAYNAAAFAPVEAALESAVTTIKDVVANTIVQADAIQNLQDTKQTMPDASGTNGTCPKFRQCLLIETDDGTPQWFPIIDPFKDFITPILANNSTIPGVDAQRRYAGDLDLCRMLPQTDAESQANNNIAKCTVVADYQNSAAANPVKGSALNQTEWGYEFKANDLADNPNNDSGIVYGISKCVSTEIPSPGYAQPATSTHLNHALWNARPTTMAEADKYRRCWCKATGIAYGGQYYETSKAPWVCGDPYGSATVCANDCAAYCADRVRLSAAFRSAVLGWAVE